MAQSAKIFTPQSVKNTRLAEQAKRSVKSSTIYNADWRRLRHAVLQEEPLCRDCWSLDQSANPATMVHHDKSVHDRPDLRLVSSNLIPLCDRHHKLRHKGDMVGIT